MKKLFIIPLAMMLLIPLTIYAQATEDAVTNGTFDTDASSWTLTAGTGLSWSGNVGNPVGSVIISDTATNRLLRGSNDCYIIPATWPDVGDTRYITIQADIFNPNGNPGNAQGLVGAQFFSDTSCTTQTGSTAGTPVGKLNVFQTTAPFTTMLAPTDVAVRIFLVGTTDTDGPVFQIAFDNVTAFSSTSNAVTLSSMNATAGPDDAEQIMAVVIAGSAGFLALGVFFRRRGIVH